MNTHDQKYYIYLININFSVLSFLIQYIEAILNCLRVISYLYNANT